VAGELGVTTSPACVRERMSTVKGSKSESCKRLRWSRGDNSKPPSGVEDLGGTRKKYSGIPSSAVEANAMLTSIIIYKVWSVGEGGYTFRVR